MVQDQLMTVPYDNSSFRSSANWLFKNKERGKTSAAAGLVSVVCIPTLHGLSIFIYSSSMPNSYCLLS